MRARGRGLFACLHVDARAAVQPGQRFGPVRAGSHGLADGRPRHRTSKNGQSGPSAQSGQDTDTSAVVIVQLAESADGEATLASINEAVTAAFPGASVSVEREYRNALRGYALRVPTGSIDVIRAVSGVQAAYPDGNNNLQ